MDLAPLLEFAKANPLIVIVILGVLLFKGDLSGILDWLKPKPTTPPVAPPVVTPPVVVPVPVDPSTDRPLIDAIIRILPTLLPLVLPLIVKAADEAKAAQADK